MILFLTCRDLLNYLRSVGTMVIRPLIINNLFITTRLHCNFLRDFFVVTDKKKLKLQLKEKIESRNSILQHAKEIKLKIISPNNQIITRSCVSAFAVIRDEEKQQKKGENNLKVIFTKQLLTKATIFCRFNVCSVGPSQIIQVQAKISTFLVYLSVSY